MTQPQSFFIEVPAFTIDPNVNGLVIADASPKRSDGGVDLTLTLDRQTIAVVRAMLNLIEANL